MSKAIEIEKLTRVYSTKRGIFTNAADQVIAIDAISFSVNRGDIFGFLGPNGAGKTTLIKLLTTVLLPTEGLVRIFGKDIIHDAKEIRKIINVVYGGDKGLYNRLTAWDNLKYFCSIYHLPPKDQNKKIEKLLDLVGLSEFRDRKVENYSRGMKQKLHIARGLINDPLILFLDEPTIGLDPLSSLGIKSLIKKLHKQGMTIFLTTHYMQEAEELCDHIAIMNKGKILIHDTVEQVKFLYKKYYIVKLSLAGISSPQLETFKKQFENDIVIHHHENGNSELQLKSTDINMLLKRISVDFQEKQIKNFEVKTSSLEDAYIQIINNMNVAGRNSF